MSLDDTYKRILKEINNANLVHAYRLLQCLAVARRPLRVEELAEVLAFDLSPGGIPKLNPDWRWEDQEVAVLSACSSLVSVIVENGSRIVQFSHFSVKEFLTSDRLASSMEVSRFYIPIEPSHAILAQACLGALLCLDGHTDKGSVKEIPLYEYAEYWVEHAQVGNVELDIKDTLDYFFDLDKPHFSSWVRIRHPHLLLTVTREGWPKEVVSSVTPLFFAAWSGLCRLVERLILKDPQQVNQLGGRYGTPLSASVFEGHFEVAQLLFAHGADINLCLPENFTPLHLVSATGHIKIGKWLLNHGANANCQAMGNRTPLHLAAGSGNLEVVRMLLEGNAEVNSRSDDGYTPFLGASRNGNPDVLRLLLDHNADIHVHDEKGNTALHRAAGYGRLEAARVLLEHNIEVDSRNHDGSTPLLEASEAGYPEIIGLLIDHNADVNVRDNKGNTPLKRAARNGHVEVARMLLEHNAEVNSCDDHGSTPLHFAAQRGYADVVQLFLGYNADVYTCDADGDAALHCAMFGGSVEATRTLLELNVEVNRQNSEGSTPLHRACESWWGEFPEVVRLLLDHGADVQVRNRNGKTAIEIARDRNRHQIVQLLSQHAAE